MTEQGPPPGWYPHPEMAGTQRYWDGSAWSGDTAPAFQPVVMPPNPVPDWLFGVGYVGALALPIVGFVIGIVVMAKGKPGHGVAMVVISVVVTAITLNAALGSGY